MPESDVPVPEDLPHRRILLLRDLILAAFSREQYLQLLSDVFTSTWLHNLAPGAFSTLVHESVLQMEREKCADAAFFFALIRARPRRYDEIRAVAEAWDVVLPSLDVITSIGRSHVLRRAALVMLLVIVVAGLTWAIATRIESAGSRSDVPQETSPSTSPATTGSGPPDDAPTGPVSSGATAPTRPETPTPKLIDLDYADADKSDAALEQKLEAHRVMRPGFEERLPDIRTCFTDWTTVERYSCPHDPFHFFNVWYDVRLTDAGKIVEVKFRTSSMVRDTPDQCVRDRWLTKVVRAPRISAGRWTLKLEIPAPIVPAPGAKNCPPA